MLLQIEQKKIDPDISVIELAGKLALGRESQRIEFLVDEMLKNGQSRVILNMTGVDYIDSAGVGLVALTAGRVKEAGGRMVAVAPEGSRVLHLLTMTQVNVIVTVCPTVEDAVKALA